MMITSHKLIISGCVNATEDDGQVVIVTGFSHTSTEFAV